MKRILQSLLLAAAAALLAPSRLLADTEVVDGIEWTYRVSNGQASVGNGTANNAGRAVSNSTIGAITIPATLGNCPVTSIETYAFYKCRDLTSITIPDSVTSIKEMAFYDCFRLTSIVIPGNVTNIGSRAFAECSGLSSITIPGNVTNIGSYAFQNCSGLTSITVSDSVTTIGSYAFAGCTGLMTVTMKSIVVSRETLEHSSLFDHAEAIFCYRAGRAAVHGACGSRNVTIRYLDDGETIIQADILSASIRDNDPTVMDVDYIVYSDSPTVNVRALAFEDGERSFAKVVRPETFIDGTDANLGDGIAANVVHRLSWKVSSDWATELAKVKFEVMAMKPDDLLLPMHFVTIPAADEYPALKVSVNQLTQQQVFDALMWLYADNDPEMTLIDGTLMTDLTFEGGNVIDGKSWLASQWHHSDTSYPERNPPDSFDADWAQEIFKCRSYGGVFYSLNAPAYVLHKMGYDLLPRGAPITEYVESCRRVDFSRSSRSRYGVGDCKYEGVLQYGVKRLDE